MKQAIAGVIPPGPKEVTVMTVWPSICVYPSGRFLGRLYNLQIGAYIFTLGNILALASIPHALFLYIYRILPYLGIRYCITNSRIVVQRGLQGVDDKAVDPPIHLHRSHFSKGSEVVTTRAKAMPTTEHQ